jgi:hypothetical protein
MTNCKFVLDNYWDLKDCEAAEQSAIQDHLDSCASCRDECSGVDALQKGLKGLPTQPSSDFNDRLHRHLQDEGFGEATVLRPSASFWKRPLALVATGVAAVFVFALISRYPANSELNTADLNVKTEPVQVGLLAEREWQESDSMNDSSIETGQFENLSPVSATSAP